jgi:uncharacterized protein (TIGR00251 family)
MRALFDTAKDGLILRVRVQPGAGRDAIVGIHGDALKLRVAAPPVSGRANQSVLALLGRELGIDHANLEITSGLDSRGKRVKVSGVEADDLEKRLRVALREAESGGVNPHRR